MPATVLIIDDEESVAWALRKACERQGYRTFVSADAETGLQLAHKEHPDAVFLDIRLPGMDGLTALGKLKEFSPETAVVIITAHGNLATAVKAVEGGAFDYLSKPFDLDQALESVRRAVQKSENGAVTTLPPADDADEIIGRSAAIQAIFKRIALVAPTDACVLITGESGTGKELVARAIHANSPRRRKPFLPVHVAALNPHLVESELFGHVKGAFTGAERTRPGLLTLAEGGTVFLDELGDIPLNVQAKLLRVLERREILPVGATEAQKVDVRIVSATHADLANSAASGSFRHDLYYRLNVYPIVVPPLSERTEDIGLIAEHYLRRFLNTGNATLPPETVAYLKNRSWPGNIRELRNALEHAAIVARGGSLLPAHFPQEQQSISERSGTTADRLGQLVKIWVREQSKKEEPSELHQALLDAVEPALLSELLRDLDGNRVAAARRLGLARATLRKLMKRHGIGSESNEEESDSE